MTVKGSNTVTLKGILVGEVWFCSGQSNMAGKFVAAKGRTLPPEVFEMDLSGFRFTAQYHPPVAKVFESIETCPDEHLLFFHHAPYTHRLHSGKTVIQHIYDSHFDGVEQVKTFRAEGFTLSG
jgi:hypothetical protein